MNALTQAAADRDLSPCANPNGLHSIEAVDATIALYRGWGLPTKDLDAKRAELLKTVTQ